MNDIQDVDYRFSYSANGGFVSEITYNDTAYNLALTGNYWMYSVNEDAAQFGIDAQQVVPNDVVEFGDEACGLTDDFWNYVWTTTITPVTVPPTLSISCYGATYTSSVLYPNPAKDHTALEIWAIEGNVTLSIIDIHGKQVQTETFYVQEGMYKKIELNNLSKGIYFVRLQNGATVQTRKLMVY
jgi:hypothetical protein